MNARIIEQLELDLDETLSVEISDELEMQLQALAEAHNMNLEDYLASRFQDYLKKFLEADFD